jgi:hypothetical protein
MKRGGVRGGLTLTAMLRESSRFGRRRYFPSRSNRTCGRRVIIARGREGQGRDDLEEKDILLSGFSSTLADHSEIESQLVDILEVERTESEQSCEVDAYLDIGDLQEGGREGVRGAT